MVNFNELQVTDKCLIIDVSVPSKSYFSTVYIDYIAIDTQDTYSEGGPSSQALIVFDSNGDDVKSKRLQLTTSNLNALNCPLDKTLFFIYVVTKGSYGPDTPCGEDSPITLGVIANLNNFYRSMIGHLKEILNDCSIPKNFIDKYLRFKAFELSIKTCHYTETNNLWNKYFKNIKGTNTITSCKCNG